MPLSKARDRERKRLVKFQPNSNLNPVQPSGEPTIIPIYNPAIHGAGDRVLILRGRRYIPTIVPELDAGGQPIPAYD